MIMQNLEKLEEIIKSYESVIVAYSGGVDSTLLACVANKVLKGKSLAVTVNSEFITGSEFREASLVAQEQGLNHRVININVLNYPAITENSSKRCKYCKHKVFSEILKVAQFERYKHVIEGSNLDDLSDYRPGFEAIKELDIKSPFLEAGFTKNDIRNLAAKLNLSNHNKPALACLASRIPYNTKITKEILVQIEKAEEIISGLGFTGFRVRHHQEIARIELDESDIQRFMSYKDLVDNELKKIGFKFVCLDLKGYSRGSLNSLMDNKTICQV